MGVQTLDENEFKHLGRGHDFKQIYEASDEIRKSNFS